MTQTLSSLAEEERAQVLVLGSSHLGGVDGVTPVHFDEVIQRLKAFGPQIIAIERIAGDEVMLMQASPRFAGALDVYVGDFQTLMTLGQAASGLDAVEARAVMGGWQGPVSQLSEGEQIDRMMIGLTAYELETALLYFRALGGPEREEWPEPVSSEIVDALTQLDASTNERVAVAARLAGELDLPRVWNVDSHLEHPMMAQIAPALMAALQDAGPAGEVGTQEPFATAGEIQRRAIADGSVEPLYDWLNTPEYGAEDIRAQIDIFNRLPFADGAGRARQALWDERNLRIAANLRRAMAVQPGARVLLVIGAGHKPWLDQLLAGSLDIRVVQWSQVRAD